MAAGVPRPADSAPSSGASPADPTLSLPPQEQLKQARATYEYGNYTSAIEQLEHLTESRRLESPQDQMEAYRLLGLAHFFSSHNEGARRGFVNLLSLDPDFQLDPLYVPPQAIAIFEQVRRDNQELLEPIRQRRRATQEALAQEEAARRRLLAQSNGAATAQGIRERIDRPSPLVTLLPFGAGQFQNDNKPLGVIFAVAEGLTLATSVTCYLWVTSQQTATGYPEDIYRTALTVRNVQVATGAAFGALWLLGAGEAFWHLRGPIVTREDGSSAPLTPPPPPKISGGLAPLPGGGVGSVSLSF